MLENLPSQIGALRLFTDPYSDKEKVKKAKRKEAMERKEARDKRIRKNKKEMKKIKAIRPLLFTKLSAGSSIKRWPVKIKKHPKSN